MSTHTDMAIARHCLALADELALKAASLASAVDADDIWKARAEKMETVGEQIHDLVEGLN